MLVNIGEPFTTEDTSFVSFVNGVVSNGQGGFSIFHFLADYDPATGVVTRAQYLKTLDASATPVGNTVTLGKMRVDDIHAVDDGSYLVSVDKSTQRFDDTGFHVDGKISLATMSASGKLTTFYTIALATVDDSNTDLDLDVSVAYGKTGTIALARIAVGTTDDDNDRVVDLFDAAHRLKATVVVDRDMTGDVHQSTRMLALSDGRYLVTWTEANGMGADVMARVVTDAGKVFGAAFLLGHADDLSTPADVRVTYATTALANGNFAFGFQASEYYFDQTEPSQSQNIQNPVESSIWTASGKGFTHGADLVQHTELSHPYFESMITLSTGQILQVVSDFQELTDGVNLASLHGYLYDANGKATSTSSSPTR